MLKDVNFVVWEYGGIVKCIPVIDEIERSELAELMKGYNLDIIYGENQVVGLTFTEFDINEFITVANLTSDIDSERYIVGLDTDVFQQSIIDGVDYVSDYAEHCMRHYQIPFADYLKAISK